MSSMRRSAAHAAVTEHNMMVADLEEAQAAIERVRAVADAWEYYASENGNVRTAWAAKLIRNALDGDA